MGLFNCLMHWDMRKEARRLAQISSERYLERKHVMENATEQEIIISMMFDKNTLAKLPKESKKRFRIYFKTINGFCYFIAMDTMKEIMNFRFLQFTSYMDKELEAKGFPKQSFQQKKEILKAMELDIDGWEKITNDKKC